MPGELDALAQSVHEHSELSGSICILLNGLATKFSEAGTDPVLLQALVVDVRVQAESLAAAVLASTPAAPVVDEPSAVVPSANRPAEEVATA